MHPYTAKTNSFYADLSDLLLLLSISLTNPDRELAAGLTKGTYLGDLMNCAEGVSAGLTAPHAEAPSGFSPSGCFSCCCGDTGCAGGCGDPGNSTGYNDTEFSADLVVDALAACADTCLRQDTEDIYHRINREYNRLFTNPRRELIPIYESLLVHRDEKKASMFINATCMHAEQTYRHNGFPFEEKNKIPGDHIAIELRYLAYLFASYLNAVQADNKASCKAVEAALEDFCRQHVQRWLDLFINELRATTEDAFYLLLAQGLEFVKPVLLG